MKKQDHCMERKEFDSKKGWVTLNMPELDELRVGIKAAYEVMDGAKEIGKSSKEIYEDLTEFFKVKFQGLRIVINVKGQTHSLPNAGATFLKNLFYTNRTKENIRGQQYNFDACYIFAFGDTRQGYLTSKKTSQSGKPISSTKDQPRVIISSFSTYSAEVDKVKKYFETHYGCFVQKDLRDIKMLSIGSLIKLYSDIPRNTTVIHLIGKEHFCSEHCVTELNHLRKELTETFIGKTSVLFLQDVCTGEYDVKGATGRLKINQWWLDQIDFMKNEAGPRSKINYNAKVEKQKAILDQMEISNQKMLLIIGDMEDLIEFLLKETRLLPYDYFINNSTPEDIVAWLKSA